MQAASLNSLPPEILQHVLVYLSTPDLFSFARTSRSNFDAGVTAFRSLRIGAFPPTSSGIAYLTNFLSVRSGERPMVRVPLRSKTNGNSRIAIRRQNLKLADILNRRGQSLRDLDVSVWDLDRPLAASLGTLRRLRHLAIRMDHPQERFPGHKYRCRWIPQPGTAWNELYDNTGLKTPPLGRLKSLRLDRAAITDYQLQRILETNPEVTDLRLNKCAHITEEFWKWLAQSRFAERLKVLHFTDTAAAEADDRILDYLDAFTSLESLSLLGCHRIDNEAVQRRNKDVWGIAECTMPSCTNSPALAATGSAGMVEVDPLYVAEDW